MRHIWGVILIIFSGTLSQAVFPYEVTTHEDFTEKALEASTLGKLGVLTNLGLKEILKDDKQQAFPNSEGKKQSINDLFRTGANFEDVPAIRVLNHFYDPLNDNGLLYTSPNWALEDTGPIFLPLRQRYSFRDGRDYFYKALISSAQSERDKNFGLTFETIGHVVHHLQDMAQPQHVRMDAHLNIEDTLKAWGLPTGNCFLSTAAAMRRIRTRFAHASRR